MKILRVAIFLTGITGLAMGGIMTLSSLRSNQEEAVLRTNEALKAQATQFVDQFFGVLEATKNITTQTALVPSYVTYRAIVKMNQGNPSEIETFASTDNSAQAANAPVDFGLQERVLNALKNNFSLSEFQISKLEMGTFALSDIGNKEGIFLATPVYKIQNGVIDPSNIEKVNLTLIDPVKAFGGLQKISGAQDSDAFLMSKHGKILAHTLSAFVGTDLKQIDRLKDSIESLFLGAQTGFAIKYKNADSEEEQIAFVRAGTYPFAFAVEEKARPAVLSGAWVADQIDSGAARRNVGILFVIIAIALVAFTGISHWATRQISHQISEGVKAREELTPDFSSKIAPSAVSAFAQPAQNNAQDGGKQESENAITHTASQTATSLRQARDQIAILRQAKEQIAEEQEKIDAAAANLSAPREFLGDFIKKIEKCYAIEGVEKELVEICSEVSESAVLYFRYHRRNQNLTLSAVSGEVKIPNYSLMQAYVRKDIELQIEQMADNGKVASISNYGPVNKLINTHVNVHQFEAWGVTSHPEVSGQSKLVGVLVVLQAESQTAQSRPLLAKILKNAGNYLYAQSNKIKPRSAHYPADQKEQAVGDSRLS